MGGLNRFVNHLGYVGGLLGHPGTALALGSLRAPIRAVLNAEPLVLRRVGGPPACLCDMWTRVEQGERWVAACPAQQAPKRLIGRALAALVAEWVAPLAAVSLLAPVDATTIAPDLRALAMLSNGAGLTFCMMTPVVLAVLVMLYPSVNAVVLRVSSFVGLLLGAAKVIGIEPPLHATRRQAVNGSSVRLVSLTLVLGMVLATMSGCNRVTGGVARADVLRSAKARLAAPSSEAAGAPELVEGNTQFALDLYRVLYDGKANLFCSPYSISLALAMTYAGARGQTAQEMASALHFTLPQDQLHPAFNALDQALASRGERTSQEEGQRFQLRVANALWGQKDFPFQAAFLDLLAQNYGAGLRLVDYRRAPEDARQTINRWVEEQTEQKVKDLLPSGSIDDLTRLVLSNAVYFNAGWLYPFQKESTQDGAFHLLDGGTRTVPLMHQSERLGYAEGEGYQLVELPYVGSELSMVILLPAEGTFERFARALDAQAIEAMLRGVEQAQVSLTLPRFRYEAEVKLGDALTQLGMAQVFTTDADFSGMTGKPDLYIDNVYHKALVAVDEKGTEAAAATAVVMVLKAIGVQPVEVRVDRPFIFLIRDVETGTILFLGHVVDPSR